MKRRLMLLRNPVPFSFNRLTSWFLYLRSSHGSAGRLWSQSWSRSYSRSVLGGGFSRESRYELTNH